jgi:hypothetical protein
MRRSYLVIAVMSLLLFCTSAYAQVFYEYPAAPVVGENEPVFGPAIAIGEDLFRLNGFARFNVAAPWDFGLEIVFDRIDISNGFANQDDSIWRFGAGADIKYLFIPPDDMTMPFDLAFNAGFGFESGGDITDIIVPVGALISKSLEIAPNRLFTPYAGVYLLIIHTSVDFGGSLGDVSDTDTDVELRGGGSVSVTDVADIFAALHLGNGTKFYVGLNWRL